MKENTKRPKLRIQKQRAPPHRLNHLLPPRRRQNLLQLTKNINYVQQSELMEIFTDSEGALSTVNCETAPSARTKHFNVCLHNSRHLHQKGVLQYKHVYTEENPADIFTKALHRPKHQKFVTQLGLRPFEQ
jgi:hypothetical protein